MPNIHSIYKFNCHGIPGMPNIYIFGGPKYWYNMYKFNCHGIPGMPNICNIYNIYKFGGPKFMNITNIINIKK